MAEITRKVGDVSPNNFIRPGVQKPSPLSLAANLGAQAMDLDAQLAQERLSKEADQLRDEYEMSSPGSVAVQEEEATLAPGDRKQIDALKSEMASHEAAVEQGRMSYDTYRVRGERLLRLAISKRPGLAQELRAAAAQHLGVDVVGASVDVLASWERQSLAAQAKKDEDKHGPDYKRIRDQLDLVGVVNAHLTDNEAWELYGQNGEAIRAALRQQAENEFVTTGASTMEASQKLRRPSATAAFVAEVAKNKTEVYKMVTQGAFALQSGQVTPEQAAQIIAGGKADLASRVSVLRSAMAQGDVDTAIAEKEIAGLEALSVQLEGLANGTLTNELRETKMKGTVLFMQNAMMDSENVVALKAATELFGPEILTQFTGPGGAFNKTAAVALGDTLNNAGKPLTKAAHAGTVASSVIASVLDRGGSKSNPEMIPAMGETLIKSGTSFLELTPKEFKADYLTGPNGYMTVLHAHREALAKSLGEDQKSELLGSASLAALSNYHALAVSIGAKYPSFKGKLSFDLDPTTGEFIHPKPGVTLSPTEQAAVRSYNNAFAGKKVLQLIQTVAGVDAKGARDLLFSGEATYQAAKKAQKAAASKPTATAAGGSSGGNWWENL